MAKPDKNGWFRIEETAPPNNVFDVLAKRYDAALDDFLMVRFAGCVQVEDRIFAPLSSPPFQETQSLDLLSFGYRPMYWRHIPEPPVQP